MDFSKVKRVFSSLAVGSLLIVGLFLLLQAPPQTARAATAHFFVTAGGLGDCSQGNPCNLQTALSAATDGDTIFLAGGTYTGSGTAVVTVTHSITLYGGWNGASSGSVERDPDAYTSVLDGERARRVVYIGEDITPTLDGLIITSGNATGLISTSEYQPAGCGGGLFAHNAHPVIVNNVITNNVAAVSTFTHPTGTIGYGGGLYLLHADRSIISGNVIISNAASTASGGKGGGLRIWGEAPGVRVEGNQVLSNVATTTDKNAWGGGIAGGQTGTLIQGNLVQGNRCNSTGGGRGAGLYQTVGAPDFRDNIVRRNQGADAVLLRQSRARFEGNWVVDNPSSTGIQLLEGCAGGGPTLVNNVIAQSGGRSLSASTDITHPLTVILLHNTLVGAGTGDGVHIESGYVTLFLTNTIVASHTWAITNAYPASSTVVADHTLFWGNMNDGIRGTNPVDGDPRFVNPDDGDYHLDSGSAAIDAGVDAGVTTDRDGVPRPQRTATDLGAYEFQGLMLVVNIVGRGSVTRQPDQAGYEDGDVVTLTATADPAWIFDSWSGDVTGTQQVLTCSIEGDTFVTANFTTFPTYLPLIFRH